MKKKEDVEMIQPSADHEIALDRTSVVELQGFAVKTEPWR